MWQNYQTHHGIKYTQHLQRASKGQKGQGLERVKGVAKNLIFSLWIAHSSHSSWLYLCELPRDWYYIQKGSKFQMYTLISLWKQYFLLLITFCTYFERCYNFDLEAISIFYIIFSQCKWVSGVDNYAAKIAADSITCNLQMIHSG